MNGSNIQMSSNSQHSYSRVCNGNTLQHVATLQHFPKTQAPRHLKKTPTVGKRGWQQFGPRNPGAEQVTVTAGQHGPASLLEDLKSLCRKLSEHVGTDRIWDSNVETYGNIWNLLVWSCLILF